MKQKLQKIYGRVENNIIWILLMTYVVFELFHYGSVIFFQLGAYLVKNNIVSKEIGFSFTYLCFIVSLIGLILMLLVTKRNRKILKTFLPGYGNNNWKTLLLGLLIGFIANSICVLVAFFRGDLHFYVSFSITQLPYFLFTFVCVFIQSSTEELWTRGFIYERLKVKYPEWVGILANALFFSLLHINNSGITPLALINIAAVGIAYSLIKRATNSIWIAMGIHAMWNFTENFIFGLPNSGAASEISVLSLDAMKDSWAYDKTFGVEATITTLIIHITMGVIAILIYRHNKKSGKSIEEPQSIAANHTGA